MAGKFPVVTSPALRAGRELTAAPRPCRVRANPVSAAGGPVQRTHARTLTGTDPGAGPRGCGARTAGGAQGPATTPRSRAFWKEEPAASVGRGRGRSGGSRFPHASPRLHPLPARPRSAHAMDGHVATATAPQQPPPPPGSQHGRGTSGPALPVPQFPLIYSDHLRLARKEGRSGQGRSPPRSSRSPAVAALLPRTAPEPRPLRHPRANRSETDPGTCSSLPLWLCLATTPRVTRCQHQVWSCLLEHRGPWPAPEPRCHFSAGKPEW